MARLRQVAMARGALPVCNVEAFSANLVSRTSVIPHDVESSRAHRGEPLSAVRC
jgi:hypothetical protein